MGLASFSSRQRMTPIQEGRWHLRSIRDGETVREYLRRIWRHDTEATIDRLTAQLEPLIQAARQERTPLPAQREGV